MTKSITVDCPGTIANIVCGFDVLGLALEAPRDTITLTMELGPSQITIENSDEFRLPIEPTENVMGVALQALLDQLESTYKCHIVSHKKIKPGSGIGSSAASAAGIVVAANALLQKPFSPLQLIKFAQQGEFLASGSNHADNIAPCVFGGVTLIRDSYPLDIVALPYPNMSVVVLHPQIEIKTSDARAIIKKQIDLSAAVKHWGNVAGLVAGLCTRDIDLVGRSLRDELIEPTRKQLIPFFDEIKSQALSYGAIGGGISGSGPSVFMFSRNDQDADKIGRAMLDCYNNKNIEAQLHITKIAAQGVRVLS